MIYTITVATTEADRVITLYDFLKIVGISPQKEPTGVILVSFDHFDSFDFNVWLRSCIHTISSRLKQNLKKLQSKW